MAVNFMAESMNCNQCIEQLCQQGCSVVRNVIDKLEHHEMVDELEHLDRQQIQFVLKELKIVMSVYDRQ